MTGLEWLLLIDIFSGYLSKACQLRGIIDFRDDMGILTRVINNPMLKNHRVIHETHDTSL